MLEIEASRCKDLRDSVLARYIQPSHRTTLNASDRRRHRQAFMASAGWRDSTRYVSYMCLFAAVNATLVGHLGVHIEDSGQ